MCHIEISIDLEQEAVEIDDSPKKARQGILSRLDLNVGTQAVVTF